MLIYAKRPSVCMVWPSLSTITVSGLSQLSQNMAQSGPRQLCPVCVPDSSWHCKQTSSTMDLKWLSHWAKRAIFWASRLFLSILSKNKNHLKDFLVFFCESATYKPKNISTLGIESQSKNRVKYCSRRNKRLSRRQGLNGGEVNRLHHRCSVRMPNNSIKWPRCCHFPSPFLFSFFPFLRHGPQDLETDQNWGLQKKIKTPRLKLKNK